MIEDIILAVGGWILNISALTTLLNSKAAVPLTHSLPVLVTMVGYIYAYVVLGLPWAAVSTVAGFAIWLAIAMWRQPKEKDN